MAEIAGFIVGPVCDSCEQKLLSAGALMRDETVTLFCIERATVFIRHCEEVVQG
jgi:hypothetical protein